MVLQEVHVAVQQGVGRRQDSHRLHPRTALQLTLHRHVCKARQPKVTSFTKISKQIETKGRDQNRGGVLTDSAGADRPEKDLHEVAGDPMGAAGH